MAVTYTDEPPMQISATERQEFLRCRRAWDFQSPNRRSLQRKGLPATALHVGSAVHYGIEAQALGLDPIESVEAWYVKEAAKLARDYVDAVGAPMAQVERATMEQSKQQVLQLLRQYFHKWGWDNPLKPYRYIAPEISFRVPVPLEKYADEIGYHGPRIELVGTFDGLGELVLPEATEIWLIENKTYGQKPEQDSLQTDDQLHAYAWAAQVLLGVPIAGAIYNGLAKKLPTIPVKKQDGLLSIAWVDVDEETYLRCIREHHGDDWYDQRYPAKESKYKTLLDYYEPFLEKLRVRDSGNQTPFHTRWEIRFKQDALAQWEHDLCLMAADMVHPKIYPNFPWSGCWDCNVKDLCKAVQFNEDVEWVVRTNYRVGTYGTRKAQKLLSPQSIGGIDDLREVIAARREEVVSQPDSL